MLRDDVEVGDYTAALSRKADSEARHHIVLLIEDLHEVKQYKLPTLYTAVGISDRYLAQVLSQG